MTGFIVRRILAVIPTLLGVTVVIFLMLSITPGDPAELLLGERATPESLDAMREYLGLKEPLYVQYGLFLKRVVKFDLGETIWTRDKVSKEIMERFPATIELAVAAMLLSSFFGIILGLISATRQYSWFDYISMVGSLIGVSMPVFWLALVLMLIFSLNLGWFPMSGRLGVDTELTVITNFYLLDSILTGNREAFWDALRHLALPAIALSRWVSVNAWTTCRVNCRADSNSAWPLRAPSSTIQKLYLPTSRQARSTRRRRKRSWLC